MTERTTYTVRIDEDKAGNRADKVLAAEISGLSRSRIQALIAAGRVSRGDDPLTDGATKVKAGEVYAVAVPPPAPAEPPPRDIPLYVLHEDDHLIVLEKPSGLVVHPAPGHADDTLVNALLHHCRGSLSGIGGVSRPGIVHRLDKDTSGVMVAAKDDRTHQGLAGQFADHTIQRAYQALVWGVPRPAEGTVEGNIGRNPRNRKKMAVRQSGGKFARTRYRLRKAYGDLVSQLECRLETGRTHQIRVHMAHLGHPLIGDAVYGGGARRCPKSADPRLRAALQAMEGQALHAFLLGFCHPVTGEVMRFESKKYNKNNELLELLDSM